MKVTSDGTRSTKKLALFATLLLSLPGFLPAQQVGFIEHPLSTANSGLDGIVAGPDGALWFNEFYANNIGRITTAGVLTEYPLPAGIRGLEYITVGPDGALWFTEFYRVGRITTAGAITEYTVPTLNSSLQGITAGPDGALWFAENGASKIGRITTVGVVTEYPVPTADSSPFGITAGPDGALWFTENGGNKIGRITTVGVVTEYPLPTIHGSAQGITAGPDGALWFTEESSNKIGRITTAGAITEYPLPTPDGDPFGITVGPDGALWFTEFTGNRIGRITTAGAITDYAVPTADSAPLAITAGPDGALWFTELEGNKIGQLAFTTAVLNATPDNGVPFSNVTFSGSGFAPSEQVNLYAGSTVANLFSTATADTGGSFVVSGPVAPATYGTHSVVAVGQNSHRLGLTPFSISPLLKLTPHSGTVGSRIAAEGFGFGVGERVKVYWNNPRLLLGTAKADSRGIFSQGTAFMFLIPEGAPTGLNQVFGVNPATGAVSQGYVNVE